jgi:hypothetical protein
MLYEQQGEGNMDMGAILSSIGEQILSEPASLALIGLSALIGFAFARIIAGGFSVMYIIPLIMLLAILNYVVFPLSFIFDAGFPEELKIIFVVFFNLLTVLVGLGFVRGSI